MRWTSAAALGVALFVTSLPGLAQDEDPIDAALSECLSAPEGETTTGMLDCAGAAYEAWDAALNGAYDALMAVLNEGQQAALRAAQRKWIGFRDADRAFAAATLTEGSGTMQRVSLNFSAVDTVRARVLTLRGYLTDQTGE